MYPRPLSHPFRDFIPVKQYFSLLYATRIGIVENPVACMKGWLQKALVYVSEGFELLAGRGIECLECLFFLLGAIDVAVGIAR